MKFLEMKLGLLMGSIVANITSLDGQIKDYNLTPTKEQIERMEEIEKQLHDLVQEITK